jgi:hypothetical protein
MAARLRVGDPVTVDGMPGLWRIHHFHLPDVHLTGLDDFAKLFCSLDTYGIVATRRTNVHPYKPLGDTLL